MWASFNRFELRITLNDAKSGHHQGACDDDVAYLVKRPYIAKQLDKIHPDTLRLELQEYGAWDSEELSDDSANRLRIVWIACGNIVEE